MYNFTVDFENGTSITDNFKDMDDFNTWIMYAIKDFGKVTFIHMNYHTPNMKK